MLRRVLGVFLLLAVLLGEAHAQTAPYYTNYADAWSPADPGFQLSQLKTSVDKYFWPDQSVSTTNPVDGWTSLTLVRQTTQPERTQGAAWTATLQPYSTSHPHGMNCGCVTVYYYEGFFNTPPATDTYDGSYAGNQGYWFNSAPVTCVAYKYSRIVGWYTTNVHVPAYGLYIHESISSGGPVVYPYKYFFVNFKTTEWGTDHWGWTPTYVN